MAQIFGPYSQIDFQLMQDIKFKALPYYRTNVPVYQSAIDKERGILRDFYRRYA